MLDDLAQEVAGLGGAFFGRGGGVGRGTHDLDFRGDGFTITGFSD
jgi:hypothetical protein